MFHRPMTIATRIVSPSFVQVTTRQFAASSLSKGIYRPNLCIENAPSCPCKASLLILSDPRLMGIIINLVQYDMYKGY